MTQEIFNATMADGSTVNAARSLDAGKYCLIVFGSTFTGSNSFLQASVQEKKSAGGTPPSFDVSAGPITTDGRYLFECGARC